MLSNWSTILPSFPASDHDDAKNTAGCHRPAASRRVAIDCTPRRISKGRERLVNHLPSMNPLLFQVHHPGHPSGGGFHRRGWRPWRRLRTVILFPNRFLPTLEPHAATSWLVKNGPRGSGLFTLTLQVKMAKPPSSITASEAASGTSE